MDEKLVVIDTDAGIDDALAIFLTLAAHKDPTLPFRIVGIVCVNGNTGLDNVCVNVTRILKTANVTDIPIYRGCDQPMVLPFSLDFDGGRPPHHGFDGFGDANLDPIDPNLDPQHGVLALIRMAKLYRGKLTVMAIGPLTNLAMAVRLDPSIADCIKDIHVMGGTMEGKGNASMCGEFNFRVDPEAAFVTLKSFPCPIILVPLETCRREDRNLKDFRLATLSGVVSPEMLLMGAIEKILLETLSYWLPCDVLTAAVLIQPDSSGVFNFTSSETMKFCPKVVIEEVKHVHATVELSGSFSRGLMVLDHNEKFGHPKNVHVVCSTHEELVKKLLIWAVGGPSPFLAA